MSPIFFINTARFGTVSGFSVDGDFAGVKGMR
jgi:hypothetical protein